MSVLPTQPTGAELTTMAGMSDKSGTYSLADGLRPKAAPVNQFNIAPVNGNHVLAIGQPGMYGKVKP